MRSGDGRAEHCGWLWTYMSPLCRLQHTVTLLQQQCEEHRLLLQALRMELHVYESLPSPATEPRAGISTVPSSAALLLALGCREEGKSPAATAICRAQLDLFPGCFPSPPVRDVGTSSAAPFSSPHSDTFMPQHTVGRYLSPPA